ncbi:MAG: sensor domain-containing diguanylate cyclase [Myxococcota bacterium]
MPPDLLTEKNVPSLPAVALRILELSKDEDAGLDEYAEAISSDPALTAKILRLSNSSMFGLVREVTTLRQATSVLGLRTINMMALGFSLARVFPSAGGGEVIPFAGFWRRSLLGAVAGREFATLAGTQLGDEAFLCGLLSQIGSLVLAQGLPERYAEVVQQAEGWPSLHAERAVLGFDSADVAEALLDRWGMPALVRTGVVCWSDTARLPDDADERSRSMVTVVSQSAAAVRVLSDEAKGESLETLRALARDGGLSKEQVDTVLLTLELRARQTAELLEVELPDGPSHLEMLEEARHQLLQVSLRASTELDRAEQKIDRLQKDLRQVTDRAQRDELTGLRNRAAFDDVLAGEIRSRRDRSLPGGLGLVMMDIDRFKEINDNHGHQVGDEILHGVGQAILASCRDSDTPARYGGDEFAIIVPATTIDGLEGLGERLRKVISDLMVSLGPRTYSVTVSVGAAALARAASLDDGKQLISIADQFLYRAKQQGRDRCEVCPGFVDPT